MSPAAQSQRVGIVGLGLIGGSLALALRRAGFCDTVLAWDRDPSVLDEGCRRGVIDAPAASLEALLDSVDVAVLAAPTVACEALLRRMLEAPGATRCITDVASVKGPLSAVALAVGGSGAARYVPGHPIAGSERSGVASASAGLFSGHRVILTPAESTAGDALALVDAMWRAAGASVDRMSVAEHDAVLAATSHLPHVLAYALVDALAQSPVCADIFRFAAGGFRDFTRIASSDPVMWRDIALANRGALLAALDDFNVHLAQLRDAIERGDGAALEQTFRAAKDARDAFARDLASREAARAVHGQSPGPDSA